MKSILVTFHKDTARDAVEKFRQEVASWSGVAKVGDLHFSPKLAKISPFFFVYIEETEEAIDAEQLIERLARNSLVRSAAIPPSRSVATVGTNKSSQVPTYEF